MLFGKADKYDKILACGRACMKREVRPIHETDNILPGGLGFVKATQRVKDFKYPQELFWSVQTEGK